MNYISIHAIEKAGNTIKVLFEVSDSLSLFFSSEREFTTEYSQDVSSVPDGVAVIPFVANVLPIIWVTDAQLNIPVLDKDFFGCIESVKNGYRGMFPMMEFKGKVCASVIDNFNPSEKHTSSSCAAFFSGGVDAFATLIAHADEKPDLMTIWGSDIKLNDFEGWNVVYGHLKETCRQFGLNPIWIKSNFRTFIDESELNKIITLSKDNWWHGFQHGIGIVSHGAPLAWLNGYKRVFMASSFTINERGKVTCASDPTIDGEVRYAGAECVHDQYECNRQDKIHNICEFVKNTKTVPSLRVCWVTSGGHNCCKCEKCLRTMIGLFAEGADPKDFGFDYSSDNILKTKKILLDSSSFGKLRYLPIQKRLKENPNAIIPAGLEWFVSYDLDKMPLPIELKLRKIYRAVRSLCRRVIRG